MGEKSRALVIPCNITQAIEERRDARNGKDTRKRN